MGEQLLLQNLIFGSFATALHFFTLGTCRVLIANARWRKWQIKAFKFNVLVALVASFVMFGDIVIFQDSMPDQLQ